jgi:PhnB protein
MLYVKDCDAIYKQALEAGAISLRGPADQPYGDRMSGVEDPFGFQWWIATHIRDVSLEEMQAATHSHA